MKLTVFLLTIVSLLVTSSVSATTATVTAQQGTGVSSLLGAPLSGTQIDLGHYDGSAFTLLAGSIAATGSPLPEGLFGGTALVDSRALVDTQPAIRIVSDDGSSVIMYSTEWSFTSGDGTGTDTSTDFFDVVDVVSGGALTATGTIIASTGSQFNLNGNDNPTFGMSSPSLAIGQFTAPPTVNSDNAENGVATDNTTHTFTWQAPASNSAITGYSYALDEVPDGTVDSTAAMATYTDLAPGNYTFQVKAITDSGVSEVATFDLVINSDMVIPTMTEWGIIILISMILLVALHRLQADAA